MGKDDELIISISEKGKKIIKTEFPEERFLKKSFPFDKSILSAEEKFAFDNLIKRKNIIKQEHKKIKTVYLTTLGKEVVKKGISKKEYLDRLTSKMLKDKSWKKKSFRAYDFSINCPSINKGKRPFFNQALVISQRTMN